MQCLQKKEYIEFTYSLATLIFAFKYLKLGGRLL